MRAGGVRQRGPVRGGDRGGAGGGDVLVLGGRPARGTDGPDEGAVDHDRDPTAEGGDPPALGDALTDGVLAGDRVVEVVGGQSAEAGDGPGLVLRDRAGHGEGTVHPGEREQPTGGVGDRDVERAADLLGPGEGRVERDPCPGIRQGGLGAHEHQRLLLDGDGRGSDRGHRGDGGRRRAAVTGR